MIAKKVFPKYNVMIPYQTNTMFKNEASGRATRYFSWQL